MCWKSCCWRHRFLRHNRFMEPNPTVPGILLKVYWWPLLYKSRRQEEAAKSNTTALQAYAIVFHVEIFVSHQTDNKSPFLSIAGFGIPLLLRLLLTLSSFPFFLSVSCHSFEFFGFNSWQGFYSPPTPQHTFLLSSWLWKNSFSCCSRSVSRGDVD